MELVKQLKSMFSLDGLIQQNSSFFYLLVKNDNYFCLNIFKLESIVNLVGVLSHSVKINDYDLVIDMHDSIYIKKYLNL